MKKQILFFFLFLIGHPLTSQTPEYGLRIRSYPFQMPEFTTMALEDGRPIETKGKDLSLNFRVWVRNENVFGTVFRIITDKGKNIDLLYSVSENDKRFPILVTGEVVHPLQKEVRRETWSSVHLTLSPQDGNLSLQYDSMSIQTDYPELKGTARVRISFGLCPFENFSLADVASVDLKDVGLYRGKEMIRYWEMACHHGDTCYDNLHQAPATGKNTSWIIDQYITWKPIYTHDFPSSPSIAFDPATAVFYMATGKTALYTFNASVLPSSGRTDVRIPYPYVPANMPPITPIS